MPRIHVPSSTAPEGTVTAKLSPEPFVSFVAAHRKPLEALLTKQLRAAQRQFPKVGKEVAYTTQAIVELSRRGGKRYRPGLVLAGHLCVSPTPNLDACLQAGAAIELLHAFLLVHDDWMDGDLLRRGGPSVHAMLRATTGSNALGDAAAILAGDWGAAVATDWMAMLPIPTKRLPAVLRCFVEMQTAAVTGQIRDLLAADGNPERTYELKTASYSVNGPLQLGALLGGSPAKARMALEQFAMPLGVAFQLQDDLIGVFSPEAVTGKPFASDLKQGKRTPLIFEGRKRADKTQLALLNRVIGNPTAKVRDLEKAVRFLETSGARAAISQRINRLYDQSLAALDNRALRPEGKELLRSAATALVARSQ